MRHLILGLMFAFVLASTATAETLDDGVAAHERWDYATALLVLRPLADQGVARAQDTLGLMYAEGRGVE